ncbi:transposase, partial [Teichococcus vastitatis]|uniref:transposase n=1 Tax=Teichococcus vastitatis TaxID=2307076 RepID=UPI003520904E
LVLLPPYAPELNPVERLWLYLRERFLLLQPCPGSRRSTPVTTDSDVSSCSRTDTKGGYETAQTGY